MNRLTIIGLIIVACLVLIALFAPWIAPHDVGATNLTMRYLPPSHEFWFGTDSTGRDIFSRVVFGARISLQVGIIVVSVSAVVGTILGALAGYYGGWIDRIVSGYLLNVFLAFPGLLLAIAMVAFLGAGLNKLILALCVIGWGGAPRGVRGRARDAAAGLEGARVRLRAGRASPGRARLAHPALPRAAERGAAAHRA